ncbi:MAG: hypothetical protein FRX49_10336 [Trebouxia sp. A1-2]|nr:MAG: hypothetical protein FRX49_10336 [Trebouxia sp. A1-2]
MIKTLNVQQKAPKLGRQVIGSPFQRPVCIIYLKGDDRNASWQSVQMQTAQHSGQQAYATGDCGGNEGCHRAQQRAMDSYKTNALREQFSAAFISST